MSWAGSGEDGKAGSVVCSFVVPPHPKAEAPNEEQLLTFASLPAVLLSARNLLGLNSKGGFLNLRVRGGR